MADQHDRDLPMERAAAMERATGAVALAQDVIAAIARQFEDATLTPEQLAALAPGYGLDLVDPGTAPSPDVMAIVARSQAARNVHERQMAATAADIERLRLTGQFASNLIALAIIATG